MGLFKSCTKFLITLIVVSIICTCCGYSFRANGKPVGIEFNSIAIPIMTSTSSNRGFEADFTRVIREEFISHAQVPIVRKEDADLILAGRVYGIETRPLTYESLKHKVGEQIITHETTSSRRLKVRLDISLTDRATGKIIWHESSMEEEARFNVEADPLVTRYNQQQALIKISRLLAQRIYLKTMERF